MHLLFLLTQDLESPSGLGRYWPLARSLAKQGHQVRIAALHANFNAISTALQSRDGVEIHYVAPMHVMKSYNQKSYYSPIRLIGVVLRATLALTKAALTTPTDLIVIGKPHPMNGIAGLCAKILRGKPIIVDCDDYETGSGHFEGRWQKRIIELFEKHIPQRANVVTTNTHFMRDNLISWGVPAEQIVYLPNGVDPERFVPPDVARVAEERERLNLHGKKVVAYIGSLSLPSHPVYLLVDAFSQLHQAMPNTVLLIVGGGEETQNLKKQVANLGIETDTRFVGHVVPEDIPLYYALADVSVDPVYDDPAARGRSPLKLFESWMCGVPFVSVDVGERTYLLGKPPAGVLTPPDESLSLAEGIAAVLSDVVFSDTLTARGKERVIAFHWDVLAKTFKTELNAHLKKSQPAAINNDILTRNQEINTENQENL